MDQNVPEQEVLNAEETVTVLRVVTNLYVRSLKTATDTIKTLGERIRKLPSYDSPDMGDW